MRSCKKYKRADNASFVTKPDGDCTSCLYFSAANCGQHIAQDTQGGGMFSSAD
jgi:hypothetical protein